MTGAAIRFEKVRFGYDSRTFDFDFEIGAGETAAVMGASGSGKSTLLHLLAGFEHPHSGRILIGGRDVTGLAPQHRPVTMVFQDNNLFAHLDVGSNVGLGLSPNLSLDAAMRRSISEALDQVGLSGMERRLPGTLSGGERQRVALARALVRDRPVLLLDEPFAALGPALRAEMAALVAELHRRKGMTLVLVSHDPDDMLALARRVLFLHGGRIAFDGTADALIQGPLPAEIAEYLGRNSPESERGR